MKRWIWKYDFLFHNYFDRNIFDDFRRQQLSLSTFFVLNILLLCFWSFNLVTFLKGERSSFYVVSLVTSICGNIFPGWLIFFCHAYHRFDSKFDGWSSCFVFLSRSIKLLECSFLFLGTIGVGFHLICSSFQRMPIHEVLIILTMLSPVVLQFFIKCPSIPVVCLTWVASVTILVLCYFIDESSVSIGMIVVSVLLGGLLVEMERKDAALYLAIVNWRSSNSLAFPIKSVAPDLTRADEPLAGISAKTQALQTATTLQSIIRNIAHDLTSPLQGLEIGFESLERLVSVLIISQTASASSDEARKRDVRSSSERTFCLELVQSMRGIIAYMSMLINRYNDTAIAMSDQSLIPSCEYFSMAESITRVVNCISDVQTAIKIAVDPLPDECSSMIYSDKRWFESNLLCLLTNAVSCTHQHHTEDSPVEVKFRIENKIVQDRSINLVFVELHDSGDEFDEADFRRLASKPLSNGALSSVSETLKVGGGDFGLYALFQRIRALGGTCSSRRRRDEVSGSVFWFSIPYRRCDVKYLEKVRLESLNRRSQKMKMAGEGDPDSVEKSVGKHVEWDELEPGSPPPISREIGISYCDNDVDNTSELSEEAVETAVKLSRNKAPDGCMSVLLVDDSITVVKIMAMSLRKLGHLVDQAQNGAVALALMMENEYDFVLMDMSMPVMDGFEAVTLFRQQEASCLKLRFHLPQQELVRRKRQIIVGMSSNSDIGASRQHALQCGMDALVAKPASLDTILRLVGQLMKVQVSAAHESATLLNASTGLDYQNTRLAKECKYESVEEPPACFHLEVNYNDSVAEAAVLDDVPPDDNSPVPPDADIESQVRPGSAVE